MFGGETMRVPIIKGEALVNPTLGRLIFTQKIQEKLILVNFHLPSLETFNGSTELIEHIIAFRAQMLLYCTLDVLMCYTFPIMRMVCRLKQLSISSFNQLTREFKLHFIGNMRLWPLMIMLLGLRQGEKEMLADFAAWFTNKIWGMIDAHPSLRI